MSVQDAAPQDAAGIAALIRAGFEPEVVEATIYGCPGIASFIEGHIANRLRSPYRYKVFRDGASMLGAAEFRLTGETLFLNYVAVHPNGQGRGVGRALLEPMVCEARGAGASRFALDVFVSNSRAREWYERLGMTGEFERAFWVGPQCGVAPAPAFAVPDLPQADLLHRAFGFSEVTVECGSKTTRVGRLGARYFRLVGAAVAMDVRLRGCLQELDPSREVLALLESDEGVPERWRKLIISRRMSVGLDGVRL